MGVGAGAREGRAGTRRGSGHRGRHPAPDSARFRDHGPDPGPADPVALRRLSRPSFPQVPGVAERVALATAAMPEEAPGPSKLLEKLCVNFSGGKVCQL